MDISVSAVLQRIEETGVIQELLAQAGLVIDWVQTEVIVLGVMLGLGILFCFFGLKLVRLWSALLGLVAGVAAGSVVAYYVTAELGLSAIIGLAAGVILAVLFAVLKRAGMFLISLVLAGAVSMGLLQPKALVFYIVCGVIALAVGLLTIKLAVPVVMIVTAVYGGISAGWAAVSLFHFQEWIGLTAGGVLAAAGILIQFSMESGRRKKQNLRRAAEIREQNSTENEVDRARSILEEELQDTDSDVEYETDEYETDIEYEADVEYEDNIETSGSRTKLSKAKTQGLEILDDFEDLDELDEPDELDVLDEFDEPDELDELDGFDEPDEFDEPDALDDLNDFEDDEDDDDNLAFAQEEEEDGFLDEDLDDDYAGDFDEEIDDIEFLDLDEEESTRRRKSGKNRE